MQFDSVKLGELMLYIADRSTDDPSFGATKLNKVLFFSDFLAYANLGASITGAEYQKLKHGPAPRQLLPIQRELVAAGAASISPQARSSFVQKRLVALRAPDLSRFTAEEIATVDEVLDGLRNATATAVSQLSHKWSLGWKVARLGETIPYNTVYWSAPEADSEAVERAKELSKELGLVTSAA